MLGTGGMGTVYLAEDTRLGRRAALKFLAEEFCSDRGHLDRFIREARAASSLNHPNICIIFDIDADRTEPFIAMEYIEGEPLSTMIRRSSRSSRETIEIAIQTADALFEAHSNGIIHRDVKPANIIVTARGRVKILDFGLAKKVVAEGDPGSLTRPGMILGTASYMSPEQARGLDIDGRSDIWSLGVTMYEMLTGKLPYSGETIADTLASVLTANHAPLQEYDAAIPDGLEKIVAKTLAKRPGDRYSDSAELLNDLRSLQAGLIDKSPSPTVENSADEKTQVFANATTDISSRVVTGEEIRERNLRPNNLSRVLSPIIGRHKEINALINLMRADETRLITMTGIGGTGKTKLARTVAEEMLVDFTDGVFFVDLAAIRDPELVIPEIAKPLGIADGGGRLVGEALVEYLGRKNLLLVIDNFEQVVSAAPLIADLLVAAERTKMLITSRSLLRLSFETEFPVPPLAVPLVTGEIQLADILANEAVRLFETRARAVKHSFSLNAEIAETIVRICSKLDGLPLAIELAAARIRILSPEAILKRLDDRMQLLSGGSRDLPDRHRTMRDMIDWSYELLGHDEQLLFRRLAVFAGSFSIEAAEAVCGSDSNETKPEDRLNILDLITSLSEKSLISERLGKDGEPRFRMLEVVRDFADELLESSGEAENIRLRQAEYYLNEAELAEPLIQASDPGKIFERFELEHDNIRSVMRWATANEQLIALRIAVALRNFWLLHGHLTEGYGWLNAVSKFADEAPAASRFKLFSGLGLAARFRGDHVISREAYESGLIAGEEAGDRQAIGAANRGLGLVAMQQDDLAGARKFFDNGLAISRELSDDFGVAMSLSFLGDLCRVEDHHQEARPMFEEAAKLFRNLERKVALGDALNNLGTATFRSGEFSAAKGHFAEAAEIALEVGNQITLSHSLDGFAALAVWDKQFEHAARLSGSAEKLRENLGYKNEPAERAFRDSYMAVLRECMDDAEFHAASHAAANEDPKLVAAAELAA